MKIGFAGLGLMGLPMARRLLDAGHELLLVSGNEQSVQALAGDAARPFASVVEAAEEADVFCACRVTAEHSEAVFLGDHGVAAASTPPGLCIDFATINPVHSRSIGHALAEQGIDYIDAPVSGGPGGAVEGTLSIIAGGGDDAMARAMPLFQVLGRKVHHVGDVGAGVTAKLCNNMISITTHALVAESMVLGVKSGVDARALYEVLAGSSAYSRTLERVVPTHFLARDFEARATMETIIKDLASAIELGAAEGVELRLADTAMSWFRQGADDGHRLDDIASVILAMERSAGVKVGPA